MDMTAMHLRMRVLYHQASVFRLKSARTFEQQGTREHRAMGYRLQQAYEDVRQARLKAAEHHLNRGRV